MCLATVQRSDDNTVICRNVSRSGCAENFDALTGAGLRDRAYTWTASVMLVMAHEYLKEE